MLRARELRVGRAVFGQHAWRRRRAQQRGERLPLHTEIGGAGGSVRGRARGRDDPSLRNTPLFPAFSYVRPEPVLVK